MAAVAFLFVPLLLHLEEGGVARWLPLGRALLLHSGALLLPLLIVLAASAPADGEGPALAALLADFTLAAILGPFPFPLIGYGASPILGFALALGAMAGDVRTRGCFHASP